MVSAQFFEQINSVFPFKLWEEITVVVAVSGGPDSVALLRGLVAIAKTANAPHFGNLVVAHINHGIRGAESDADAEFVKSLAKQLNLAFRIGGCGENGGSKTISKPDPSEESLRDFRYQQLLKISGEAGARYIVTGHNFDDQVETILFRIFRGTGIGGLTGIAPMRLANDSVTLVRPMLGIRRSEILAYLESIEQPFRTDASNSDSHYTRNYLRNELIPELENRFGKSLEESVARLGYQAADFHQFVQQHSEKLSDSIVKHDQDSITLDCRKLKQQPELLVREFLNGLWIKQAWPRQDMTYQWWSKISCVILGKREYEPTQQSVLNLPGHIRFERGEVFATFEMQNVTKP